MHHFSAAFQKHIFPFYFQNLIMMYVDLDPFEFIMFEACFVSVIYVFLCDKCGVIIILSASLSYSSGTLML